MKSDDHIVTHAIVKKMKLLLLLCRGSVLALAMVSQLFWEKRTVGGCVGVHVVVWGGEGIVPGNTRVTSLSHSHPPTHRPNPETGEFAHESLSARRVRKKRGINVPGMRSATSSFSASAKK